MVFDARFFSWNILSVIFDTGISVVYFWLKKWLTANALCFHDSCRSLFTWNITSAVSHEFDIIIIIIIIIIIKIIRVCIHSSQRNPSLDRSRRCLCLANLDHKGPNYLNDCFLVQSLGVHSVNCSGGPTVIRYQIQLSEYRNLPRFLGFRRAFGRSGLYPREVITRT